MPTRPRQFHKFRKANIEALPPDAVGTYGLYSGDICNARVDTPVNVKAQVDPQRSSR